MEEKITKSQFAALASRVKQHDEDLKNLRNEFKNRMEMVHAAFFVVNDTFVKMADAFNKFYLTINQLIAVLKGNALSISGVEDDLDNPEIIKLYHRQSYIFDRIEKMDETVGKLAAAKSKKSSSFRKR